MENFPCNRLNQDKLSIILASIRRQITKLEMMYGLV